jgi:hypothetical protein
LIKNLYAEYTIIKTKYCPSQVYFPLTGIYQGSYVQYSKEIGMLKVYIEEKNYLDFVSCWQHLSHIHKTDNIDFFLVHIFRDMIIEYI